MDLKETFVLNTLTPENYKYPAPNWNCLYESRDHHFMTFNLNCFNACQFLALWNTLQSRNTEINFWDPIKFEKVFVPELYHIIELIE